MQIQHGDIEAALNTLSSLTDHPDAYRLRSLVFLSQREPLKAKAEAEKALSLAPSWYWIRRTAATVRYLASLSPVALPNGFPEWPVPIDLSFVRQDNESVVARRSAALDFEQLSGLEFDHSANDLACIQAWRVACLADNADSREDAADLARAILDADPTNYKVMIWVLGRDLDVTIDSSIAAIEEKVRQEWPTSRKSLHWWLLSRSQAGSPTEGQCLRERRRCSSVIQHDLSGISGSPS